MPGPRGPALRRWMFPLLCTLAGCGVDTIGGPTYVGRVAAGQPCGDHTGWHGSAVGDEGVLRELCEYTWTTSGAPDLAALGLAHGITGLMLSAPRTIPLADAFSGRPELREALYAAFMARIGRVPVVPDEAPPYLYIVDTIPESLAHTDTPPTARHGLTLRELAENILCANASSECAARIVNTLGLPRVTPELVDLEHGGSFGTLVDLARGIDAAIDDWDLSDARSRLVVLLAVGWEPGSELAAITSANTTLRDLLAPGGADADVQTVLAALARASCRGALVVAAAGNATSEPCDQVGPMGPAFLQTLRTPDAAECAALGFAGTPLMSTTPTPLILSAAHVGLDGGPLANTRSGTSARVTAQGAAFGSRTGVSELLIGSSVAATVVATTAAAVWSRHPNLSRPQLFELLQRDVAATDAPQSPHEVRLCTALAVACVATGAADCAFDGCSASAPTSTQIAEQFATALEPRACEFDASCDLPHRLALGAHFPTSEARDALACGTSTTNWPAVTLPPVALGSPVEWTEPQPKDTYCPTCIAQYTAKPAQITVGLSFKAEIPTSYPLMIEVQTASAVERYAIDSAQLDWHPQGINLVQIQPAEPWRRVQTIRLVYYVQSDEGAWRLVAEPLLRADTLSDPSPYELCDCMTEDQLAPTCDTPLALGESDPDHDGVRLICDNDPSSFNPEQADMDMDGLGDGVDACPTLPSNTDLADSDGDGIGDPCDRCRQPIALYNTAAKSANAPVYMQVRNIPFQQDFDQDGIGDVCDNCIVRANCGVFGPTADGMQPASIGDAVPFADSAACQTDNDMFPFIGDACTVDDGNGAKPIELPGSAGPVGLNSDEDFDQDGLANLADRCPRQRIEPITCAGPDDCPMGAECTGTVCNHVDTDNDGVGDLCDTCPSSPNPKQVLDGGMQEDDPDEDFVGSQCETNSGCNDDNDPRPLAFYSKVADGQCCVMLFNDGEVLDPGRVTIDEGDACTVLDPSVPILKDCPEDQENITCRKLPFSVATKPGVGVLPAGCDEEGIPLTLTSPEIKGDSDKLYAFACLLPQPDHDRDGVGDRCDLCPFAFDPSNAPYTDGDQVWPTLGAYCNGGYDPDSQQSFCD
jgi:hypothetical protein